MSEPSIRQRCPVCGLEHAGTLPGFCARPSCGVELLPGTEEKLRSRTFQLINHFSLCVLPFSFTGLEGPPVWDRLTASSRWKERLFSPDNPEDVERTEYFLPYIRRFLFPSLYPAARQGRVRRSCWRFDFDLSLLGQITPQGLALTMRARDSRKNLDSVFPLLLEKVELIVFSYRVGFLVFHFQNADPGATYFDQMDALVYLRTLAPLYKGFELPELVSGEHHYLTTQLMPYLLAEFSSAPAPASPRDVPVSAPLPVKPIYDDRMMVYAFSCLDKDTALPNLEACEALLRRGAIIGLDERSTTRPHDAPRHGTIADWLLERRQGFSKDGSILVAFNTDRFHARFLGVYQRTYYFDVFLLAALQRVTLLTLFESFSDINALITGGGPSRKLLRRVRRDLLLFKCQCWFSQITNRERGLVLWRKWQKVFENRTLLREVNEQSEELNTYLQARYREHIEWLVRLGSFLAAAIPTIFGIERFLGSSDWVLHLRWVLLTLLIVGTATFGWFVLFRQRDED